MGCASSGPMAKVADSVKELANKEGKAVQDFGAATKDTVVSGINHANEVVGSAFKSVEEEVGQLTSKATNFLNHAEEEAKDVKNEAEQLESNVSEAVNEASSDAETVVMSEVGNMQNEIESLEAEVEESLHNDLEETKEAIARMEGDNLILEDIEHFDHHLGETVDKGEKKLEKLMSIDAADSKDEEEKGEKKAE